jgi:Mg-chelatase subunit ChlD
VPFALPVDHGPVVTSIQSQTTGGSTPTRPALEASIEYVGTWASSHGGRRAVIVLITDGEPGGCTTNTVQDVANVAASGLRTSGIRTFVVGIGSSLTSLDLVAASGGTGRAYLANAGDAGDLVGEALARVRSAALATGCAR